VSSLRPAVFLDRDGTLNVERDLVRTPQDLVLHVGTGEALRALQDQGFALIVVTNQSARARGQLSEQELNTIHARLSELLLESGVTLDGIFHCPHHPTEGEPPLRADCECRKPAPGMFFEAASQLGIDLKRSWMIGDDVRDIVAGGRAGVRSLLVQTGKGERSSAQLPKTKLMPNLAAAAAHVIAEQ